MEEKTASGGAGSVDAELVALVVDDVVIFSVGAVDVAAEDSGAVFGGERFDGLAGVGVAEFVEVGDDGGGAGSAGAGVRHEGEAVGSGGALEPRRGGEEGFDEVALAQHGGGEDGGGGAAGEEEFGDLALADVGGGTEGGFPVAEAPVEGGVNQTGVTLGEGADALGIAMGGGDHFERAGGVGEGESGNGQEAKEVTTMHGTVVAVRGGRQQARIALGLKWLIRGGLRGFLQDVLAHGTDELGDDGGLEGG